MKAISNNMKAADPVIVRAQYRKETRARPRGKGKATKLTVACAKTAHGQCHSLTCLCRCHERELR